jgi:hypothetical protein
MKRDSDRTALRREPDATNPDLGVLWSLGQRDEKGFHVTLVTDLEKLVKHPLNLFGRFDTWDPDYDFLLDEEDDTLMYRVKKAQRVTLGFGYNVTESIRLKFEYYDYLGDGTREPGFDDSRAMLQLVVRF